jgi:hypothetical protein
MWSINSPSSRATEVRDIIVDSKLPMQKLGATAQTWLRVVVIGIAAIGSLLTARSLFKNRKSERPLELTTRFPDRAIFYDGADTDLGLWRVCQSFRSRTCFIVGTTADGKVVEGAPLYGRLAHPNISAAHAARLAARILGDDPSTIAGDRPRLKAIPKGGEPREVEAPRVEGDMIRYWTYGAPSEPCVLHEINVKSWDSKVNSFPECVDVEGASP